MRTIIYVDGLNLYHGLLQWNDFYWVDIKKLCQKILPSGHDIIKIKYFTAPLSNNLGNAKIEDAHNSHFLALKAFYSPREFELFLGRFIKHKTKMQKVGTQQFIRVWKREEKHTDVNIAAHILNDAWLDNYDCAYDCIAVVSNDSDLREALRLVKDTPEIQGKKIYLATPMRKNTTPSGDLKKASHRAFKIEEKDLDTNCQLPSKIQARNFDTAFCKDIKSPRLFRMLKQTNISKPFANW